MRATKGAYRYVRSLVDYLLRDLSPTFFAVRAQPPTRARSCETVAALRHRRGMCPP